MLVETGTERCGVDEGEEDWWRGGYSWDRAEEKR
jgi:hypothetical protein